MKSNLVKNQIVEFFKIWRQYMLIFMVLTEGKEKKGGWSLISLLQRIAIFIASYTYINKY